MNLLSCRFRDWLSNWHLVICLSHGTPGNEDVIITTLDIMLRYCRATGIENQAQTWLAEVARALMSRRT